MNALYLTYAILAVAYFLLRKKWDTKWLQQGNYLFLALVATVTLIHDLREYVVAYFSGYLMESLAFIERQTGTSIFLHLFLFSIIPAIGVINYAKGIRQKNRLQVILCLILVGCLFVAGYRQQSLYTFIPFYVQSASVEPGWHTVISQSMGILPLLITLCLGIGITTLLGKFLKWRDDISHS